MTSCTIIKYPSKPKDIKEHFEALQRAQNILGIGEKLVILTAEHVESALFARAVHYLNDTVGLNLTLVIPNETLETASRLMPHIPTIEYELTIGLHDRLESYIYVFDNVEDLATIPPLTGGWHVAISIKQEGTITLNEVNTLLQNLVKGNINVTEMTTHIITDTTTRYNITLIPIPNKDKP